MRHWHKEPAPATSRFVKEALLRKTRRGLKAVLEIKAYPGGHVTVSVISGRPRSRTILQRGEGLMFNDGDEAKDAVHEVIDRVVGAAGER
jgi:hypothetical protein